MDHPGRIAKNPICPRCDELQGRATVAAQALALHVAAQRTHERTHVTERGLPPL